MFQLLLEKYHLKGPTKARRQHFGVPVPKVCKGRDKEDANMSQGIKRLPRVHDPGRHSAVVSTGHGVVSGSEPSRLPSDFPSQWVPDFCSQHL